MPLRALTEPNDLKYFIKKRKLTGQPEASESLGITGFFLAKIWLTVTRTLLTRQLSG